MTEIGRQAFQQQFDGLRKVLVGFANVPDLLDEYLFGSQQSLILSTVNQAAAALGEAEAFELARTLIETLVHVSAEREGCELATETVDLIARMRIAGVDGAFEQAVASKALSAFPKEPRVRHTVFVDEAGTSSWTEGDQPVLTLVGILAEDRQIVRFDEQTARLLHDAGRDPSAEFHAQECLSDDGPFGALARGERHELLKRFVQLGMQHSLGVHHLAMLKPFVREEFRQKTAAAGLDAYTTQVLYFNVTLQVACLGKIAFAKYRYLFDRTDRYRRDIRQIVRALQLETNERLRIHAIAGNPEPVDSEDHRFVQLADIAGYYLTRYRQLEVKTFQPRLGLLKHRAEIEAMYEVLHPKLLSFVRDRLFMLIDWSALQDWAHPRRRR